jgi:bacterial/archaeal transporter family protein
MGWIVFSILAALAWAIANIIDKFVLTNWVNKPAVPLQIFGVVGLMSSLIVYFLRGFSDLSISNILLALFAGLLYALMSYFYYFAVKLGDISRVIPLFYLAPLFILLLASVFIGEQFTAIKYAGIFLLVFGSLLISIKDFSKITFGKASWLMILSALAMSLEQIITKYLLSFTDFWTIFSWIRIGSFLALIPVYILNYSDLISAINKNGKKVLLVISMNEAINIAGVIFITIAASIGYITLVNSIASIQPLFVLALVLFMGVFFPKFLNEKNEKSTILVKLAAILTMLAGAIMVA